MAEYTPTTEEVREIFYDAPGMQRPSLAEHFDRWRAAHDEQVRAEAKRAERKRLRANANIAQAEAARLADENRELRKRVESLENSLEARDRHVDVVQARAEGERAAAERIAEDAMTEAGNLDLDLPNTYREGIHEGLVRAAEIARGEAGSHG